MTDSIILKEYSNQEGTTSASKDSSAVASNGEKINEIYFSILYRRKEQEKNQDTRKNIQICILQSFLV